MPTNPTELINHLQWRYATKVFDATKTIPPEIWKALEHTLLLAPSSFGLQPWKFFVVTDAALKSKLRAVSWKQSQVTDCSHYIIFAAAKKLTEADIDRYFARTVELRGGSLDHHKGYRKVMIDSMITGGGATVEWAIRQAYIALGGFMTAAAALQVDTCPMEGFETAKYDEMLGLDQRGFTAAVCCAAGYRSDTDKYASAPKIRYPHHEVIEYL